MWRFKTLITVCLLIACCASSTHAADDKLVIAHYMTDMVPQTNRPLNRWINPELADPTGSTAVLGGLQQTVPWASVQLKNADLTTAVDFEIRAARQLGVDGFQFYYPLGDNRQLLTRYNEIIGEFIRQSESRYPGFKVSLCLAHPQSSEARTEAAQIALWSTPISELVHATSDSPAWLKTDSGQLLFYLWVGDSLADGVDHLASTPAQIRAVGHAYQRLSAAVGVEIDYVYQVRRKEIDRQYIDSIVQAFPAVWGWTASEENLEFWDALARRCRETGCLYTQTVYPDYYTSKLYRQGTHNILSVSESLQVGATKGERHYRITNLSRTQIQLFKRAIDHDVSIINYVTWNDFPEGHHLSPEVTHGFGPSILLRHFKRQWQSGEHVPEHDQAVVFFKKYRHDVVPQHDFALKIKSNNKEQREEDCIELATLLTAPAECYLNNHSLGVAQSGLQVHRIASEPGPVHVRLVRDGKEIISFKTPESITNTPLRTDRLTYSYSSEFEAEFAKLFAR